VTSGINTIIFPVRDLSKAKELWSITLGVAPVVDESYYVGFSVGDQHIGLDPHGHSHGMTGPVDYCHVDDIEATLSLLVSAGAEILQPAKDVGGGKLVATVTDADRHVIGLLQPG
jgi:predicted enzyme related to lactoylglutathione lyase